MGDGSILKQTEEEENHHHTMEDALADKMNKEKEEKKVPTQIAIMEPILRFLQLLCENHNRDLQVFSLFHCALVKGRLVDLVMI